MLSPHMSPMFLMPCVLTPTWSGVGAGTHGRYYKPIARDVTGRARTGAQLELFAMGKMYISHLCHSFAKNACITFLIVVGCWTTHTMLCDITLLAGIQVQRSSKVSFSAC